VGLAVLRIVVCAVVLLNPATQDAVRLASLPHPLGTPLEGLWSFGVPVTPMLARVAQVSLVGACLLAIVGVSTRASLVVATVAATYVLGLPQRHGNVIHHHHLVWLLALLAISPAGDALAYDAPEARRSSRAYAAPLAAARVTIGFVYLFPGIWKLREAGLGWALSDNLRNQMWWKWLQYDWTPAFRIDHHPMLLRALGLGTLAFELSFVVLVLFRRTRLFALAMGLAFHLGTAWLMKIDFPSIWLCYLGLLGDDELHFEGVSRAWIASAGALLLVIGIHGVRGQMRSWPFACYPTFQWKVGTSMPDLLITGDEPSGRVVDLWPGPRTQPEWGIAWSLAGLQGGLDRERLEAFVRAHERPGLVHLRAERVFRSVVPEDHGRIVRRELLLP